MRSVNFRATEGQGQPMVDHGDDAREQVTTNPHDEERELMRGVQDIGVADAAAHEGLLPVFGSDGIQQHVSLGTTMGSEGEPSVGAVTTQVKEL
jgi:hypothetical protein